jgi:hypothetical protein
MWLAHRSFRSPVTTESDTEIISRSQASRTALSDPERVHRLFLSRVEGESKGELTIHASMVLHLALEIWWPVPRCHKELAKAHERTFRWFRWSDEQDWTHHWNLPSQRHSTHLPKLGDVNLKSSDGAELRRKRSYGVMLKLYRCLQDGGRDKSSWQFES